MQAKINIKVAGPKRPEIPKADVESKAPDLESKPAEAESKPTETEVKPAQIEAKPADVAPKLQQVEQSLQAEATKSVKGQKKLKLPSKAQRFLHRTLQNSYVLAK